MTGKEATLKEFFYGTEPIIIPVYQRNYTWKKDDCKLLFEDIINISNDEEKTHFIGSIVHVKHSDGNIIIDGQQRITTLSILLLAMRNAILKGDVSTQNETLTKEIEYEFLVNQFSKDKDRRMKLKPFRDDCKAFDALFGEDEGFVQESLITDNYKYFYEQIVARATDPQKIYNAIKRLVFVQITLNPLHGDNAQQIFESINSTGVRLTEADKIRNFVLMNLDAKVQERFYNTYWLKIENNTGRFMEDFMRDYLTMMCRAIPNKSEVYRVFKEYTLREYSEGVEPLLESLRYYSQIFRSIKECKIGSPKANAIMANLEQLDLTTTYPFLLSFLNYQMEGNIDEQEVERILKTMEAFLFRRIMMGYYNSGLNKVFYNMHSRILKAQYGNWKYSDVLTYLLQHGISYFDFPKDGEFKKSFEERAVYKMRSNYRTYLFCMLEESLNKESAGVKEKIESGVLSIEHVMPQTLTDEWKKELGDEFTQDGYERWVDNIGNLTLTAYNSEYSNRKFTEKRDGVPSLPNMKGFKDSCVAMNKYFSQCDRWTISEIEARSKRIAEYAVTLWPYSQTDFTPMVIEDEFIPIDADYKFRGRSIKSYTFNGATVSVDSWADAFTRIVRSLYEMDASILHQLAHDKGEVYYSKKAQGGYNNIADGVYLNVACSTDNKLRQLHRLLDMYKLEPDEISVALWPKGEKNQDVED